MTERYHPDSDQVAFAGSLSKSLLSILPLSRLHEAYEESAQAWADLQGLGVFEIATPEQDGGSGLGAVEEALIVIELGRRVIAPSVLATVSATHLPAAVNRLPPPASRRVAAGYRRGDRVVYVEDAAANLLLVRDLSRVALFPYPKEGRELDAKLWSSRLLETRDLGDALVQATPAQSTRLRLLEAATLSGIARAALDMGVEYANMREQFGRPIGSFQAVKHHCSNMAIAARQAADLVAYAAVAIDDARDDAALQVESALFVAATAAIDNCGKNIQVHGGMGFSEEADPHRLLKRARVFVELAGGIEAAIARVGSLPSTFGSALSQ
jgi:alkylation response protein AidB-like acyl-CoA dehydrogenase